MRTLFCAQLVGRFLRATNADLALARNLRRDHIDEEVGWIRSALVSTSHPATASAASKINHRQLTNPSAHGSGPRGSLPKSRRAPKPAKMSEAAASDVEEQWGFYQREQSPAGRRGDHGGSRGAVSPSMAWVGETACAEGAMVLMDLRVGAREVSCVAARRLTTRLTIHRCGLARRLS